MAPSTNTITINVTQQGAQQVTRAIEDIGRGAGGAATSVRLLQGALATLGVGAGLSDVINQLSTVQGLKNQIASVTEDIDAQTAAFEALADAAVASRQPLDSLVQLYQKMGFAARDLGLSHRQMIDVVEAVSSALTVQNATAEQSKIIITELSRAMVEGTITSRDWMALIRNAPQVIGLLSRAMHDLANTDLGFKQLSQTMSATDVNILKASQSTAVFKFLLDQGKISSKEFALALANIKPALDAIRASLPTTISQAFVNLNSEIERYIGRSAVATSASNAIVAVIGTIGRHIDDIRKGAETAAIAMLAAFGPAMLANVVRLGAAVALLALRNPWIALLAAVGAVVGAIVSFDRDSQTANVSVGLLRQGLDLLVDGAHKAGDALAGALGKNSFEEFARTGLSNLRSVLGSGIPLIAGMLGGTFDLVLVSIRNGFEDVINKIIAGLNRLPFTHIAPIDTKGRMTAEEAFNRGFSANYDAVSGLFDRMGRGWDEVARRAEKAGRDSGSGYASGVQESIGPFKFQGTGGQQGPTPSGATLDQGDRSNASQIVATLKELGANDVAIAGFLANFKAESGFNPGADAGPGGGVNFAQWTGPRRRQLQALGPETGLGTGLEMLRRELMGPYASALAAANAAPTGAASAGIVLGQFEGITPGNAALASRGRSSYGQMLQERQALATGYLGGTPIAGPQSNPLENQPTESPTAPSKQEFNLIKKYGDADEVAKARRELEDYSRALDKLIAIGGLQAREDMGTHTALEEKARLLAVVTGKLWDQVDPLDALLRPLREQVKATQELDPVLRAAGTAVDKMTESLRKQGVVLKDPAALRAYVVELEHAKAVNTELDNLYKSSSTGAVAEFQIKLEALNKALADGTLRVDEYNTAWAKAKADVLEKSDSMFDGIEAGLLRVSSGFGTESKIWSDAVQSVFSTTESFVEQVVTTGKGKFKDLVKSIEGDLTKAAFKSIFKELLGLGSGTGEGGTGSGSGSGGLLGSVFGMGIRGAAGGGGGAGESKGGSGFGALSSLLGPTGNALGGGGGLLGNLFAGGNKDAKETPLGDYWLSYAQGLKDKGSDVQAGLKEAGIDAAGLGALKSDSSFWSGAGQPGLLGGIGDWFRSTFATGGQFFVPGQGGTDTVPVQFMATPGERVTIETPSQQLGMAPQRGPRRGYADGGDFDVGTNFRAPDWVPDYLTNEEGPLLRPGANQPTGGFTSPSSVAEYRRLLSAGSLFQPPTPAPAALNPAGFVAPRQPIDPTELVVPPTTVPPASQAASSVPRLADSFPKEDLDRLMGFGMGPALGAEAAIGALARLTGGAGYVGEAVSIGGRAVAPGARLMDPFGQRAAGINLVAALSAASGGGGGGAARSPASLPDPGELVVPPTVMPFDYGPEGMAALDPSILLNMAPTVGKATGAGGIAPAGGGRAPLSDLVGRTADRAPSDVMDAVATATGGLGTSADAVDKAAAQSGDWSARNKAEKGKGLGGWGWAAIAAAALAAGGGLAYYLTHKKKPKPYPSPFTWPNNPGAFPTKGSYPGGAVYYAPAWTSTTGVFHPAVGTPPPGYLSPTGGFAEGGGFDVPDIGAAGLTDIGGGIAVPSTFNTVTPQQALGSLYGMTGIPNIQGGIAAAGRGEYLAGLGQAAAGAAQLGSLASPVGRLAGEGVGAVGGVLGDVSGTFVGSKGAAGMLAASRALKSGMPAEEVWARHGWAAPETNVDRAWKAEISDLGARVNPDVIGYNLSKQTGNETTLGELLHHPELYRSYPELGGLRVSSAELGAPYKASYEPASRTISLNTLALSAGEGHKAGYPGLQSSLLHEAQHAVQHIEGFGRGASTGEFLANGSVDSVAGAQLAYTRTSGEVEARLTEARAGLSGGQRRLLPPWEAGNPYGPDVPVPWQQYRGAFGGGPKEGFADGGGFAIPDERGGGPPAWMANEDYAPPRSGALPGAAAYAERGSLTVQEPIGLPFNLWNAISGMAGQFGSFASSALFGKGSSDPFGFGDKGLFGSLFADGGSFQVHNLRGFADGGSFDVGGYGGTDSQLVAFKATPGETVDASPPAATGRGAAPPSGGSSVTHNWSITTPDPDAFMRSSGQIAAKMGTLVDRQTRRNS